MIVAPLGITRISSEVANSSDGPVGCEPVAARHSDGAQQVDGGLQAGFSYLECLVWWVQQPPRHQRWLRDLGSASASEA